MKTTRKTRKAVSAETIARLAEHGADVSKFFTNSGSMMGPMRAQEGARRVSI
jgi:hypothetical protein